MRSDSSPETRSPVVAVRGTGSIGLRHLAAIRAVGARGIAVPVRSSRDDELRAQGFEVARDLDEAAARGATHAVIATDTSRHVADALGALASGMDVLVEKPLGSTASDVLALAAFADRIQVAYCLRHKAGLAAFRARLPSLGALHAVRIACQSYLPDWRPDRDYRASYSASASEGGVVRDLSHEIDYAIWLFGAPTRLVARLEPGTRLGIAAEAAADVVWTTAAGVTVSLRLDYLTRRPRRTLLAQGSEGEMEWDAIAATVRTSVGPADDVGNFAEERDVMMRAQMLAFLKRSTAETISTSFREGLAVLRVCDAIRESSAEGRAITLPEVSP